MLKFTNFTLSIGNIDRDRETANARPRNCDKKPNDLEAVAVKSRFLSGY